MAAKYKRLLCFLLTVLVSQAAWAVDYSGIWSTKYDYHFQKYSKRYFGADFDWTWWKAQSMAESALDSTARSYCGALGIMQIMPGTWDQIANKLDVTSPWIVKDAIQAGIYYDAKMWSIWKSPRPTKERVSFTLASYNAGAGNIIKAQRLVLEGQNANYWGPVAEQLHKVTGQHHEETIGYVQRIKEFRIKLHVRVSDT